jgi:hypothetical protein
MFQPEDSQAIAKVYPLRLERTLNTPFPVFVPIDRSQKQAICLWDFLDVHPRPWRCGFQAASGEVGVCW